MKLDSDHFWRVVSLVLILIAVLGSGYALTARSHDLAKQARLEAIAVAGKRATAKSTYARCVESIYFLSQLNHFNDAERSAWKVLSQGASALLGVTPKTDPAYPIRAKNAATYKKVADEIEKIDRAYVPTIEECQERRQIILSEG